MNKQLLTFILSLSFLFSFSQIANHPNDLILCDDDNDGFAFFDLSIVASQVLGSQNGADYSIAFYETQEDADTGSNIIASPSSYTNSAPNLQTIYVRLEEVATGNYGTTSFDIIVNPLPSIVAVTTYELCDFDNTGDEQEQFDLTIKDTEILNGQTNISVTYYQSQVDVDTSTNAITGIYTNVSNPQTIYASLTNTITNCSSLVTFDLLVNPVPVANTPQPLTYCDPDNDGFGIFSLTGADNEITGGEAGLVVTYHETLFNANINVDAIDTSVAYNNILGNTQTLYVRVENAIATDCGAAIVELQLIVEPTPQIVQPSPLVECDGASNDGFTTFDLTTKAGEILNGLNSLQYTLSYYESEVDAMASNNPIANPAAYTNITAYIQTLWIRVEDTTTVEGCYGLTSLNLNVDGGPSIASPSDYVICENDGNETETIVVIDMINLIFDPMDPSYTLNLYESYVDSQNMTNPIFGDYTNISNPQTIYYSIEDSNTGCLTYSNFSIEIINCDSDGDSDNVDNSDEDVNDDGNFANDDTDMDGIPNYLDDDDDGDNVLTIDEDYNNNGDPTDDDTNGNMIPDYLESGIALNVESFNRFNFSLFPNPAKSLVTIRLNSARDQNFNVNVYDVQGKRVVVSQSLNSDTIELDTSKLSSGLYFVQLKRYENTIVQKLIIE